MDETNIAADRLKSIIERVERLQDERKALGEDIKDVMQEAKSAGYSIKALKLVLKRRKENKKEVESTDFLVDTYENALEQV